GRRSISALHGPDSRLCADRLFPDVARGNAEMLPLLARNRSARRCVVWRAVAGLPPAIAADDGAVSPGIPASALRGGLGWQVAQPEIEGAELMGGVAGVGSNHKK